MKSPIGGSKMTRAFRILSLGELVALHHPAKSPALLARKKRGAGDIASTPFERLMDVLTLKSLDGPRLSFAEAAYLVFLCGLA